MCQVCVVCLCKPHFRKIPSFIFLSVVVHCAAEGSGRAFSRSREIFYLFDIVGKKYGRHNRGSFLVSAFLLHRDIPMGMHILLRESKTDQCGSFLIWT